MREVFESADWYGATTLGERSRLGGERRLASDPGDPDLARLRLRHWRSQSPFEESELFVERLRAQEIDEETFMAILGEGMDGLRRRLRSEPSWLKGLRGTFEGTEESEPLPLGRDFEAHELGLMHALRPLLNAGYADLRRGITALSRDREPLPWDPDSIAEKLIGHLPKRVLAMAYRALILELHISRLEGRLSGTTPRERFTSFARSLADAPRAIEFLKTYPVLARQLHLHIHQWVEVSLEFLDRLREDWPKICRVFSSRSDPNGLIRVESELGDRHHGGRSTMIATFDNGLKLVYKPRSLAMDRHFRELLEWLDTKEEDLSLRAPAVLDRRSYGWAEHVEVRGCETPDEIGRFYRRQGAFLALLYVLEATDFHYENLIACGEHPILVDFETLFHPPIIGAEISPDVLADFTMPKSVLRIGLLPRRIRAGREGGGIDVSGLGARAQETSVPVSGLECPGTDRMRIVRKTARLSEGQHRPSLANSEIRPADYTEEIVEGFTDVYRLLERHREELLSPGGPLTRFAEAEARVLLRPTEIYSRLHHASFHTDFLQDAVERNRLFDRLWSQIPRQPDLKRVVLSEVKDLELGDVPRFTTRPESRDLRTSSGERLEDFFPLSGQDLVSRRLERLGQRDLERQTWILRASMETTRSPEKTTRPGSARLRPGRPVPQSRFLDVALEVGKRLETLAFEEEDRCAWLQIDGTEDLGADVVPVGVDLYKGLAGIGHFLGYLGALSGRRRYAEMARKVFHTVRAVVDHVEMDRLPVGAFDGWGGLVYALTHFAVLDGETVWLETAERLVSLLPPQISRDSTLDVIGGSAGCLASLLALYSCRPRAATLEAARQCGEHLVEKAVARGEGVAWPSHSAGGACLTGFSHGAAGVAWALLGLEAVTAEQRYLEVARGAIRFERALYSPSAGNWPDLRFLDDDAETQEPSFVCAWCHGAPGIGLARIASLPRLDDAKLVTEIETATATTLEEGFGRNHSLCHGDLGNLELVLAAGETLEQPQLIQRGEDLRAGILESLEKDGFLCGATTDVDLPGLMTGIAGIGYGLLRQAFPGRVPSVLLLEPPIHRP